MKIRGQIDYEISVDENNDWTITYEANVDNEIAAVAMAKHVIESVCSGLSAQIKDENHTKTKKHLKAILEKGMAAHFGSGLILEYMQAVYVDFKNNEVKDNVSTNTEENKAPEPLKIVPNDDLSLLSDTQVADETKDN